MVAVGGGVCVGTAVEERAHNVEVAILTGGERGPALVPGKPDESRIYRFAAGLDKPQMPPGKELPAESLLTLREWIRSGAALEPVQAKEDTSANTAKLEERPITAEEKNYWAFRPVTRPNPPALGKANPVDAAEILGPHVRAIHAKDGLWPTDPSQLGQEVLIGQGKVDFKRVFTILKAAGYTGAVTIERETSGPQQIEDVKKEKAYLEAVLREVWQ